MEETERTDSDSGGRAYIWQRGILLGKDERIPFPQEAKDREAQDYMR